MFSAFAKVEDNRDIIKVVSNVDSIAPSKKVGDKVDGVLLTFHKGQGHSLTSAFEISDKETLYLEAIGRTLFSENGTAYNYILYVPDVIKNTYDTYCKVSNGYGNSFWWYMSKYYGVERGDWETVLNQILNHKDGLNYPKESDIESTWLPQKTSVSSSLGIRIKGRYFSYDPVNDTSYGGEDAYSKEFKHYFIERNQLHLICFPVEIYTTYQLGGGTCLDDPDRVKDAALYWYLETYFAVSPDALATKIQDGTIEDFLSYVNSHYIKPKTDDVKESMKAVAHASIPDAITAEKLEIRDAYAYLPETLCFDDGAPVSDNDRPYINIAEWSGDRTVYWIYLPASFIAQYEEDCRCVWKGESDLFAHYLVVKEYVADEREARSYMHDSCLIPRTLLASVLNGN